MANPLLLSFSISFLLLFHGSLARHQSQQHGQDQCQLNMLEAREPDNRIEAEAGLVESWNPNHDEFQCVGVAVARYTVEQNGLHLPSYYNAPVLIHVVQGRALLGVLFPGCPETFEESQQESQRQGRGQQGQEGRGQQGQEGRGQQGQEGRGQQGQQGRQFSSQQEDRHQKIRRIREGDIIAIPAGVAFWTYNEGDQQLVTVDFIHTDNEDNQLDQNPRRFYLAGNPEDAFNQQQSRRSQQGHRQGQQGNGNNVYSGFDTQLLADALNINEETARKLKGENDNRKNIIRVQGKLDTVSPQRSRQERQEEQRLQEELQQERQQQGRGNGLEETFCSARLKENIADPSRADVYSPRAGRVTTVNSYNLPILRSLGLSAERGFLYQNAFYTPHWNINAHSIIYAIRGSARVQVVDDNGNNMFDQELRQGQVLTVPQNFAVMKKASNEGFEWVSFKTNDRATMTPLAGRVSALRALPDDVVSNIFQLSRDEAKQVKFNRRQVSLLDSSSSQRRLAF